MADDDVFNEDEEFQFGDGPADGEFDATDNTPLPGPKSNALQRYALLAGGLLIVVFAVYKMLGLFFAPQTAKPTVPTATLSQPPIPRPQAITPEPIRNVETPTPVTPVQTVTNTAVQRRVAALEISNAASKNQLAELSSTLSNVNIAIKELDEKIANISESMETLTMNLNTHRQRLATIEKRRRQARAHKTRAARKPQVSYTVQAIVPGRAWLMSSAGRALTVRQGSQVPGHGTVKIIDPHQGIVMMSSGRRLTFASEDS